MGSDCVIITFYTLQKMYDEHIRYNNMLICFDRSLLADDHNPPSLTQSFVYKYMTDFKICADNIQVLSTHITSSHPFVRFRWIGQTKLLRYYDKCTKKYVL